jgi:hypothetical protein
MAQMKILDLFRRRDDSLSEAWWRDQAQRARCAGVDQGCIDWTAMRALHARERVPDIERDAAELMSDALGG